jgi:hypothetical protein
MVYRPGPEALTMTRDNVSNGKTPTGDTRVAVLAASADFVGDLLVSAAWKRIIRRSWSFQ